MTSADGYAWAIWVEYPRKPDEWQLCSWVEPTLAALVARGKPSPEARVVRVQIAARPRGGRRGT